MGSHRGEQEVDLDIRRDLRNMHRNAARFFNVRDNAVFPWHMEDRDTNVALWCQRPPPRVCIICASQKHKTRTCPHQRCPTCLGPRHGVGKCRTASVACQLCGHRGHSGLPESTCFRFWTQKSIESAQTDTLTCVDCGVVGHASCGPLPDISMAPTASCCFCGKRGHCMDKCMRKKENRALQAMKSSQGGYASSSPEIEREPTWMESTPVRPTHFVADESDSSCSIPRFPPSAKSSPTRRRLSRADDDETPSASNGDEASGDGLNENVFDFDTDASPLNPATANIGGDLPDDDDDDVSLRRRGGSSPSAVFIPKTGMPRKETLPEDFEMSHPSRRGRARMRKLAPPPPKMEEEELDASQVKPSRSPRPRRESSIYRKRRRVEAAIGGGRRSDDEMKDEAPVENWKRIRLANGRRSATPSDVESEQHGPNGILDLTLKRRTKRQKSRSTQEPLSTSDHQSPVSRRISSIAVPPTHIRDTQPPLPDVPMVVGERQLRREGRLQKKSSGSRRRQQPAASASAAGASQGRPPAAPKRKKKNRKKRKAGGGSNAQSNASEWRTPPPPSVGPPARRHSPKQTKSDARFKEEHKHSMKAE